MQTSPLITVGVTCYREGEWLRECWESVLAQDDDRWEAVMVMDGGADEPSRKVFDEIEHPKLRKFAFEQNMGPYPVRNKAFELTRTPYHFYLDGDDLLPPDAVGLALRTFERCPSAAIVFGDREGFGDGNQVVRYRHDVTPDTVVGLGYGGAGAYRKSVWDELGGFTDELPHGGADIDFVIGAVEAGYPVLHVGKTAYRYRVHGGNISRPASYRAKACEFMEIMARRHPKLLAEGRRLCKFLGTGYVISFEAHLEAGELREAKRVARQALARGCAGGMSTAMGMLARVPIPVFLVLRALRRLGRRVVPGH